MNLTIIYHPPNWTEKEKTMLAKHVSKKKKPVAKRVSKPKTPKKSLPHPKPVGNSMALATISYNDIVQPEMHHGTLSLLASYFPEKVIKFIVQPTPAKFIQKRPGPGGKQFDYVPGWYAKKCANYAFGFNHSFEIKSKEICGLSAIIEGRFIVNDPKSGREIFHKDDIGGHQIKFLKDKTHTPENAVDIANDYKSATTDALKRCMVQIGFFMDVYGVGEAKEDGNYANGRDDIPAGTYPNLHKVEISQTQVVQTDYIAKLTKYLDEHPKGPFSSKEKMRFIQQVTGKLYDWVKITQVEAQVILATLIRSQK